MSYLDRPRLHFFGQFTANPSTVNNTPTNYDMSEPLGDLAWNPDGRHNFSIDNCKITSFVTDGPPSNESGTVTSSQIGVLVDLDTQQQGVSQIIGMKLTITVGKGSVTGVFRPVNFADMFIRPTNRVRGDGRFSASYQTILADLQWSGESGSPFLSALKAATQRDRLSIRMNVDAYDDGVWVKRQFTSGRVAGTIGPYLQGEPTTFDNARFLRPQANGFNFAPAKTDTKRGKIVFDFGNAIPTTWPNTQPWPTSATFPGPLQVALLPASGNPVPFGTLDTSDAAYQANAFVQEFDVPQGLSDTPTGLVGGSNVLMAENPTGAFVNVEPWVMRLNPGQSATVNLWANVFEVPASGAEIFLYPNLSQLGLQPGLPVGTPPDTLRYPVRVTTNAQGLAVFRIRAGNPGNPRGFIDGQIYGVGFTWIQDVNPDPNAFVSVHVFQGVPVPKSPTWTADVFPILDQYSRLYPSMQAIIKLNDYADVVKNMKVIVERLDLPEKDPHYMPITRELSRDKKAIILRWAANGHPQN